MTEKKLWEDAERRMEMLGCKVICVKWKHLRGRRRRRRKEGRRGFGSRKLLSI
jgi:hypothetical protein